MNHFACCSRVLLRTGATTGNRDSPPVNAMSYINEPLICVQSSSQLSWRVYNSTPLTSACNNISQVIEQTEARAVRSKDDIIDYDFLPGFSCPVERRFASIQIGVNERHIL